MLIYLYLHLNLYCHILYGKSEIKNIHVYLRKNRGKRAIGVRAVEVLLYFALLNCVHLFYLESLIISFCSLSFNSLFHRIKQLVAQTTLCADIITGSAYVIIVFDSSLVTKCVTYRLCHIFIRPPGLDSDSRSLTCIQRKLQLFSVSGRHGS